MDIVKRLRKQKWQVLDEMRGLIEDTTAYEPDHWHDKAGYATLVENLL